MCDGSGSDPGGGHCAVEVGQSPPAGAAAPANPVGGESGQDAAEKVVNFIKSIGALNAFTGEDLDKLLYEWRFELLPQPDGGEAHYRGIKLPQFNSIPSQRDLRDLLIGGKVRGCHQCVAHALYPDSVPWPEKGANHADACDPMIEELPIERHPIADGSFPSAPPPSATTMSPGTTTSGRRNSRDFVRRLSQSFTRSLVFSGTDRVSTAERNIASESPRHRWNHSDDCASAGEVVAGSMEVVLRGQKVGTTVRGRPLHELKGEEFSAAFLKEPDDEKLRAVRARRKVLEKAVKLEQYQEKRLAEQIKDLEQLRNYELEHQEAMSKREEQRQARQSELKNQLDEGFTRKVKEEKAAKKADEEGKDREAKAERRVKDYHARQKELVIEWQIRRDESPEQRPQERAQAPSDDGRPPAERRKTQRVVEAEDWAQRAWLASEERPPLPPKQHDRPRASFEAALPPADAPAPVSARGAQPVSWMSQAKVVSNAFGLSEKEHAAVERQLHPGIRGAGRVTSYTK